MCGICGFILSKPFLNSDQLADLVLRMSDKIRHRGPDADGLWISPAEGLALAHRRLAVLDLSTAGNQPMVSPEGRYVLILNGEVYNFADIKRKIVADSHNEPLLHGHSDTEILLLAIELYGVIEAIKLISGMFALAVWDKTRQELTLARDKMGQKPLYYGFCGAGMIFASELSCFKAFGRENWQIDKESLLLFLRHNYIPAPGSILKNVYKLEPGCCLKVLSAEIHRGNDKRPVPEKYWQLSKGSLPASARQSQPSIAENTVELEKLLVKAVSMQMIADVPLGVFLSGGIDSSLVTAVMQTVSPHPVKTFTIAFAEKAFNEAAFAGQVAGQLKTDHTEILVTPRMALDLVPDLSKIFSEPFADSSQIPTVLLSKLVRSKVTVVLTGDGGDELFGGYGRYFQAELIHKIMSCFPLPLRQQLALKLNRQKLMRLLTRSPFPGGARTARKIIKLVDLLPASSFAGLYKTLISHTSNPAEMLLNPEAEPKTKFDHLAESDWQYSRFENMMFCDLVTYLPDDILTKVDLASMSVGLETRLPFLDQDVVNFAMNLPVEQKIHSGYGKIILRRLLNKYLPQSHFDRPKKGFAIPLASWLRGDLKDWAAALLDKNRLVREGWFNHDLIARIWYDFQGEKRSCERLLFNVLMLQSWLQEWNS